MEQHQNRLGPRGPRNPGGPGTPENPGTPGEALAGPEAVPLTSVRQPKCQLGQAAAGSCSTRPTGPRAEHRRIVLNPELVARASSGSAVNEGAVNEGAVNEGAVKEGAVKEGAVKEGAVKEAAIKEGAVKEGAVKEGPSGKGPWRMGRSTRGPREGAGRRCSRKGRVKEGAVNEGAIKEGASRRKPSNPAGRSCLTRPGRCRGLAAFHLREARPSGRPFRPDGENDALTPAL